MKLTAILSSPTAKNQYIQTVVDGVMSQSKRVTKLNCGVNQDEIKKRIKIGESMKFDYSKMYPKVSY